jgi:hypothetical protein
MYTLHAAFGLAVPIGPTFGRNLHTLRWCSNRAISVPPLRDQVNGELSVLGHREIPGILDELHDCLFVPALCQVLA